MAYGAGCTDLNNSLTGAGSGGAVNTAQRGKVDVIAQEARCVIEPSYI
jgi:hypothetical protein